MVIFLENNFLENIFQKLSYFLRNEHSLKNNANKPHRPMRSEKSSDSKSNWSLHKHSTETKFSVCRIDLTGKMKLTEELESGEGDDEEGRLKDTGAKMVFQELRSDSVTTEKGPFSLDIAKSLTRKTPVLRGYPVLEPLDRP